MKLPPTWTHLKEFYCTSEKSSKALSEKNPHYEEFACRRYNYGASPDGNRVRLVFLKDVLKDPKNRTLVRGGRFIWCSALAYEGLHPSGLRRLSFTVDKGTKRFTVTENNVLALPSKVFISNNRYFRTSQKTFIGFSTVFSYQSSVKLMASGSPLSREDFESLILADSPFRPGALVSPRLGYFCPAVPAPHNLAGNARHPCGIILGRSPGDKDYLGREFYRVRFGDTTYERIHPVQMEILNEV